MTKLPKSPQVRYNVRAKTKRLRVQRFGAKIGLLLCRPHVDNRKLPVSDTLSSDGMAGINVLTVGKIPRVVGLMFRPLVTFPHLGTPT